MDKHLNINKSLNKDLYEIQKKNINKVYLKFP